jgi:hypothetical protein
VTFAERALYHQIHPAKVFTDVATLVLGIDLFWGQFLLPGLLIAVVPPFLVSASLIHETELEGYRRSGMGAYMRRFMPPSAQALRLFGVALAFYAALHHLPAGVFAGLALVSACWANGIVPRPSRPQGTRRLDSLYGVRERESHGHGRVLSHYRMRRAAPTTGSTR